MQLVARSTAEVELQLVLYYCNFTFAVLHTTSCTAQSNAPDDGQNCRQKHVELIWIYQ
jgi:hypothetical protein